ncbi:MAG: hypothetical protein ACT4PJ_17235 [Gemmatimonadaceae bacterium]
MTHGLARPRVWMLPFACSVISAASAAAQGWNYPSFRHPQIVSREFNFALADGGDAGTSLLFQWREGFGVGTELNFDVGFADPDVGDSRFIAGGGFGRRLTRATTEMPLDILLTAGLYAAIGDETVWRVPVGISLGHRFPLEGAMAVTPYVHPRVSIDFCSNCFGPPTFDDDTDLSISFDLGVDLELSRLLSLRFSALFAGGDLFGEEDGFGISLAWKPAGLSPR